MLPSGISEYQVTESLRNLAGVKLTRKLIADTCWRLCGNIERLRQHQNVPPWSKQKYSEWVPAQITRVRLQRGGKGQSQLGSELTFRILAGTSCPLMVIQWWSPKRLAYVATKKDENGNGFGFARQRYGKPCAHPYDHASQFTTLRCWLFVESEHCTPEGPGFREIGHSSGTTNWNMEQQRHRARQTAKYVCPSGFGSEVRCHLCPIGLDRCRAAVHSKTYAMKKCMECGREGWHDPADRVHDICIECVRRKILHREEDE